MDDEFIEAYETYLINQEDRDIQEDIEISENDLDEEGEELGENGEGGYDEPNEDSPIEELIIELINNESFMMGMNADYTLESISASAGTEALLKPLFDKAGWTSIDVAIARNHEYEAEFNAILQENIQQRHMGDEVVIWIKNYDTDIAYIELFDLDFMSRYYLEDSIESVYPVIGSGESIVFDETITDSLELPPTDDWNSVIETHKFTTHSWLDENGYLHLDGEVAITDHFMDFVLESPGGSGFSTYYLVDLTFDFELTSELIITEKILN